MTSDDKPAAFRFAFFSTGANFSCEVLLALLHRQLVPDLLVLPEYPPASMMDLTKLEIQQSKPRSRLLRIARSIPLSYAPAAEQVECARLIQRQSIDFMLVACWPYLIAPVLLTSPTKAALNLHPSMLPRYPGPDPVAAQIECAEPAPGVTLHLLNQQFDQGDIVAQQQLPAQVVLGDRAEFESRAADEGCELFIEAIKRYDAGWLTKAQ